MGRAAGTVTADSGGPGGGPDGCGMGGVKTLRAAKFAA